MKPLFVRLAKWLQNQITSFLSRFPSRSQGFPSEEYLVTFSDRESGHCDQLILSAEHVGPFHRCGRYNVLFVQPLRHLRR